MRSDPAPQARAACTYSISRTTSTDARTMRAVRGVYTTVKAMVALINEGPSTAAIAMASSIAGNAMSASITRISGLSRRWKYPARAPITVPESPVKTTTINPISSESRAP